MPLNFREISRRREKLGITKAEAARRAGFSVQRWWNIERGERLGIDPDTFHAIAVALECEMTDLFIVPRSPARTPDVADKKGRR